MIPFVDLKAQYEGIKEEIDAAMASVIKNTSFIGGPEVLNFESNFAQWLDVNHFVGCANGTDALEILLKALGVSYGDEVIVPAISWISTSEAVSNVGGTPIFVDIHEDYYTINENLIEAVITSRTKVIIPVHLYGQACNMSAIMEIAAKHHLKVLEDCAQAHGAKWKGVNVGTIGHCSAFSFFPGKNLGAYGDAGGMATNDKRIAKLARMIAHHGQIEKHNHQMEGRNSRLDPLQAAILNVKLKYLGSWTLARQEIASWYDLHLAETDVICPKVKKDATHVYHLYVIRTKRRKALQEALDKAGISHAIHYPTPLPFLPCYAKFNYSAIDFPAAYRHCNEILSLPIFPELTLKQVKYIADTITKHFDIK
jgi:dTDP-4-amino-4,6-dideoxygalactose transaminase